MANAISHDDYKKLLKAGQKYVAQKQAKDPVWKAYTEYEQSMLLDQQGQTAPPSGMTDYWQEYLGTLSPQQKLGFQQNMADSKDWGDTVGKVLKYAVPAAVGGVGLAGTGLLGAAAQSAVGGGVTAGQIAGAAGLPELGLAAQTGLGGGAGGMGAAALPAFDTGVGGLFGSQGAIDAAAGASGLGSAGLGSAGSVAGGATSLVAGAPASWSSWLTPNVVKGLTAAGLGLTAAVGSKGANVNTGAIDNAAKGLTNIAGQQQQFANDELAAARLRQQEFDAKYGTLINNALASQATQDGRSDEAWKQYTSLFMPAQQKLVDTAMNYDTAGRRMAAGNEAVAGVNAQLNAQRDAMGRDLRRAGVSLSSGRSATLNAAQRFAQAKQAAAADRAARLQVENTGIGLVNNAVQAGNSVANTAGQFAGLGLQAGTLGSNALAQKQSTYNASLLPSMHGLSNASTSFGRTADLGLQRQRQDSAGLAGLGQLAGTVLTSPWPA
jgi:hypothetical protein